MAVDEGQDPRLVVRTRRRRQIDVTGSADQPEVLRAGRCGIKGACLGRGREPVLGPRQDQHGTVVGRQGVDGPQIAGAKPREGRAHRHEDGREPSRCTGPAIRPCGSRWRCAMSGKTDSRISASMGTDGVASATAAPPSEMPSAASRSPGAASRSQATAPATSSASSRPNVMEDPRLSPCALRSIARTATPAPRQEHHPACQDAAIGPDAVHEEHRTSARYPRHEPSRQALSRAGHQRDGLRADASGRRADRDPQRRPHGPHRDGAERQDRDDEGCEQGRDGDKENHPQELAGRPSPWRLFGSVAPGAVIPCLAS